MIGTVLLLATLTQPSALSNDITVKEVEAYNKGYKYPLIVMAVNTLDMNDEKVFLEEDAAASFTNLMVAAAEYGFFIKVNLGFRTHEEQSYWFNRFNYLCEKDNEKGLKNSSYCGRAAPPGHSTHQEGLSVDIAGCIKLIPFSQVTGKSAEKSMKNKVDNGDCQVVRSGYKCKTILYWWLKRNGPKYGFTDDVSSEPWHFTYSPIENELAIGG